MMESRNISHLRKHLFDQLDILSDTSQPIDVDRTRMVCEISKQIIDTARVEIQFAAVMNGALTLPFIEDQANERPSTPTTQPDLTDELDPNDDFPVPSQTAEERTQRALNSGPAADHPWRGLGGRVHVLRR